MSYYTAVLDVSPAVYYRLGDGTGTTAVNAVGGNNGTYTSPTWTTGLLTNDANQCTVFDGAATFVTSPYAPNLASFSVEFLVNPTAYVDGDRLMDYSDAGPSGGFNIAWTATANRLSFTTFNGVTSTAITIATLTMGTTYHIVCTFNGTTATTFVNGVQQNQTGALTMTSPTQTLTIGRRSSGSTNFFNAKLQEVAVYSSVLSTATIYSHFLRVANATGNKGFNTNSLRPHAFSPGLAR